jgi:hypothetical protein
VPAAEEQFDRVRADVPGPAGDQNPHVGDVSLARRASEGRW